MVTVRKHFICIVFITVWALFVLAPVADAQNIENIRELVNAGALPRSALEKAEAEIADRNDDVILKRTLYGSVRVEDLGEAQAAEMLAAAQRRVERVQKHIARLQPLVDQGISAPADMKPLLLEKEERESTLHLAENRARVFRELLELARAEQTMETTPESTGPLPVWERFDGNGAFNALQFRRLEQAFAKQFGKALPVSANGETALHRSLGYDHRGRVDIALTPDSPEGTWLRQALEKEQVPYFAFRNALAGSATAPHIHIGPPSLRLRVAD
jgi:hypothetical protein